MKFIIKKIIQKLSASRNVSDVSFNFSSFRKLKILHLQSRRGFTLVETLVAISILMIAVASPLTIAQKGLSSAIYAKDQIVASYLAQDAIEYLRNWSDQNVAQVPTVAWLDGIKNKCSTTLCTVDTTQPYVQNYTSPYGIASCSGTCSSLYYDSGTNIYNQTQVGNSTFTRSVKVEEIVPNTEALITVTMSWKDKSIDRELVVNTRIYNWR